MEKRQIRLSRVFTGSLNGIYFLLGIAAILFWTYLFGHPVLEASNITGSDSAYHLSIITWIDRWFPKLPAWYPLQGAGSSSILQYPYGAHYFVVLFSRVSGLKIPQVFRLTQFASVAATACGIYLLAWRKLHNQTMALLAGLFYPISSAAWQWLAAIGVFAQSVSFSFFAPTFLLFDAYLFWENDKRSPTSARYRRLMLVIASIAFCLMIVTHVITAFVFAMTFLLYAFLNTLFKQKNTQLLTGLESIGKGFVALLPGLGLASFWMVPFLYISSLANREGAIGEFGLNQIPYLDLLSVIGLKEPPPTSIWPVTFASPVLILAAVGFLISLKRRDDILSLTIISVVFAFFTAMPGLWLGIVKVFKFIWANVYVRALVPTMIFLPVIAGYGAIGLAQQIVHLPSRLIRSLGYANNRLEKEHIISPILKSGLTCLLGIAISTGAFLYLRHAPPGYGNSYQGYGLAGRGIAWWPFNFENGGVEIYNWPSFVMSTEDWPNGGRWASEVVEILELDSSNRVDVSSKRGGLVAALPLYSDASTIGIYYYVGSLIHSMRGYQSGVFYGGKIGSPHEVDELARWFGIEYVILDTKLDPVERYESEGWQPIPLPDIKVFENLTVREFNESQGLASILKKPKILVIGGHENGIYASIFQLFNSGVVEYHEATIIEGSHRIDDYQLEELSQFELVFLHGYGYKNRERAWNLLTDYVKGGGSLYIDTGWEYWVPEWEMDEAPEILPVSNLEWKEVAPTEQLVFAANVDWIDIDADQFSPLIWQNQSWGISTPSNGLRPWATGILEASGKPVVAVGNFGDGKVVWSGMNLVGHTRIYGNDEEREFIRSLIKWLLSEIESHDADQPEIQRNYPDRVRLLIPGPVEEGTSLLWREAYAPGWRASVEINGIDEELEIYRAGPGMMLMTLPSTQEDAMVVIMEYSMVGIKRIGFCFTGLTGILLIVHVYGKFSVAISNNDRLAATLKREQHHRLEFPVRDTGQQTRRTSMWEKLRRWLPKPILDENTHHEKNNQYSGKEFGLGSIDKGTDISLGQEIQNNEIIEGDIIDEEKKLFNKWLDSTNHLEDSWAQKILGRKKKDRKK